MHENDAKQGCKDYRWIIVVLTYAGFREDHEEKFWGQGVVVDSSHQILNKL